MTKERDTPILECDDECFDFFFKCEISGLFFVYFRLFKPTLKILQQINVKNVHPVYDAGIWTHDLQNLVSSHDR